MIDMKILVFTGGLGNQIFGYAFYCWIKDKFPQQNFYGIYNHKKMSEHYGLEINKWFNVILPQSHWKATFLTGIMYIVKHLCPKNRFLDLNQRSCINENALIYFAFKLSNKYIPQYNWITWKIDEESLSFQNKQALEIIRKSESIFIHVRRGDYLSPKYIARFEGTCPVEYYNKSIEDIKKRVDHPKFFYFSDDIEWVKKNLPFNDAYFIDWNTGENSPLDMFLMSQCKYAIIANSTFSYWGAMLGRKKELVYYPTKWINSEFGNPHIFPEDWKTY